MTNEIEVNISSLENDSDELKGLLQKLEQAMQKAYEQEDELDSTWKGDAREAFRDQFVADYTKILQICNVLKKIQESMDSAKQEYMVCEEDIASEIDAIRI